MRKEKKIEEDIVGAFELFLKEEIKRKKGTWLKATN